MVTRMLFRLTSRKSTIGRVAASNGTPNRRPLAVRNVRKSVGEVVGRGQKLPKTQRCRASIARQLSHISMEWLLSNTDVCGLFYT